MMSRQNIKDWLTLAVDTHNFFGAKKRSALIPISDSQIELIVLDSYAVHTCDEVRDALRVRNAGLVVVPPGRKGLCQPLDVSVNRSFKAHMRKLYEEWLAQSNFTYTRAGNVRHKCHDIIVS